MSRIRTLMWKEFLELRQTPRLLVLLIVAPIIQLTLLGYAATTDVRNVPIVVVDGDRSPRSRQIIERLSASPYFHIVAEHMRPGDVDVDLAQGRAWLAVVVPQGFEAAVEGRGTAASRTIQVRPTARTPTRRAWRRLRVRSVGTRRGCRRGTRRRQAIDGRVRVWFNLQLESRTHGARRHRASAPAGDGEPVVDGDRPGA